MCVVAVNLISKRSRMNRQITYRCSAAVAATVATGGVQHLPQLAGRLGGPKNRLDAADAVWKLQRGGAFFSSVIRLA